VTRRFLVLALLFLPLWASAPPAAGQSADAGSTASPPMLDGRHLIVAIRARDGRAARGRMRTLVERHPVEPVTVWPLDSIRVQCLVVRVRDGAPVAGTIRALGREAGVRIVQPIFAFQLNARLSYRDELFARQRALDGMNVPRAHAIATGARVDVAIVDTGIDAAHPDLRRRIARAADFVDDGRGAASGESHATAVAGVLAADGRNGRGIVGVAPDARILALRACWEGGGSGRCTSFSLARALNFAILRRADIINLSLSGPADPLVRDLVAEAMSRGIVVVSAGRGFPADIPGVIAADRAAARRSGAVPAPGTDVLTTLPGGRYGFRSGASISAGHVSGVVALMRQTRRSAGAGEILVALRTAARSERAGAWGIDACLAVASIARRGRAEDCL